MPMDATSRLGRLVENIHGYFSFIHSSTPTRLVVGCSGGKDSFTLCLALRELEVEVLPVVVDLGYQGFDAEGIASELRRKGFSPVVHDVRAALYQLSRHEKERVEANLRHLDDEATGSPCGPCSDTKRTVLRSIAKSENCRAVALGHHRDDFVVTLLKDYWIRAYHENLGEYEARQFEAFVSTAPILLDDIGRLVEAGECSTMAFRLALEPGIDLLRPLAFVPEAEIRFFVERNGLRTFGSGCAHSAFTAGGVPPTKREIVHSELTRRLSTDPSLGDDLLPLVLAAIAPDGSPRSRPRDTRKVRLPNL